ncbi:MAG: ribonuclease III [Candidatus Nanopelagicales bacterium]
MTSQSPSHYELVQALEIEISPELLQLALTHRSFAYENGGLPTNERLEFLGDSVLSIVTTDTLYHSYSDRPEGDLAKMRATIVSARALAGVARTIDLGPNIYLGKGETNDGGADKDSILADTLEAILGAAYLDQGLEVAAALIHRLFDPLIERAGELGAGLDWKTSLQERTTELGLGLPKYQVSEEGPEHDKTFSARAVVAGDEKGVGQGRTKKVAEQIAAEQAWNALQDQ